MSPDTRPTDLLTARTGVRRRYTGRALGNAGIAKEGVALLLSSALLLLSVLSLIRGKERKLQGRKRSSKFSESANRCDTIFIQSGEVCLDVVYKK